MTTTAYCIGLTYPTGDFYNGQHPVPEAAAANETMATIFRDQVGADYVYTRTDAEGDTVTRAEILQTLRDMLDNAEPGDNVFFSFTGQGRYHVPRDERDPEAAQLEADGANEFIWASDGPITDEDITQVLQEVPEGVNLGLILDSSASGGMVDTDALFSDEVAGNVVVLASSHEFEWNDDNAMLSQRISEVMANAASNGETLSWMDIATRVGEIDGDASCNINTNRPELFEAPAFQFDSEPVFGDDPATWAPTDEELADGEDGSNDAGRDLAAQQDAAASDVTESQPDIAQDVEDSGL